MKRKRHAHNVTRCKTGYADGIGTGFTARTKRAGAGFFDETPLSDDSERRTRQALWRACLVQHIMDAKSRSQKPEKIKYRDEALRFLFENRHDFEIICDLAGFEPESMRRKLLSARERGFIWRDEVLQPVKERIRGRRKKQPTISKQETVAAPLAPIIPVVVQFPTFTAWPVCERPKKPRIKPDFTQRFHTPVWQQMAFEFVRA